MIDVCIIPLRFHDNQYRTVITCLDFLLGHSELFLVFMIFAPCLIFFLIFFIQNPFFLWEPNEIDHSKIFLVFMIFCSFFQYFLNFLFKIHFLRESNERRPLWTIFGLPDFLFPFQFFVVDLFKTLFFCGVKLKEMYLVYI